LSQKGALVRRRVGYTLRRFPKQLELPYARDSHNCSQQSRPLSIVLLFVPVKVRPEFGALDAASLTDETPLQV
jgi:hypothetical protein